MNKPTGVKAKDHSIFTNEVCVWCLRCLLEVRWMFAAVNIYSASYTRMFLLKIVSVYDHFWISRSFQMMSVALNHTRMAPWFTTCLALKVFYSCLCGSYAKVKPCIIFSALRRLFWISHGEWYIAVKEQTFISGLLIQWILIQ